MIKVLVTGSNGLVGMNLRKEIDGNVLHDYTCAFTRDYHFTFSSRKDTDLLRKSEVFSLFEKVKPKVKYDFINAVDSFIEQDSVESQDTF